jgi:16S rRNA (cytidine1402-2'-O)-methyltransferase
MSNPLPTGTLFVVSTPIGNLEDITLRALRVLREARIVAAEDTRRTARLLTHYGITTPTLSLHAHNEHARTPGLLDRLRAGESIALVTDAGTPLLSDPGLGLVRAAIEADLRVEPIPGPSAILAALVASGLPAREFLFLGFPPNKSRARKDWYRRAGGLDVPFVVFEAPHRLVASLRDALEVLGPCPTAVSREVTKVHEEHVRGNLDAVLARFEAEPPRGELTVVFSGTRSAAPAEPVSDLTLSDEKVWHEVSLLTESGSSRRQAIVALSRRLQRPTREIYASAERGKARLSSQNQ